MCVTHRLRQMLFTMNSDFLLWKSLIAVCLLSNLEAPEPTFHFKGVTSPTVVGDQSVLPLMLIELVQTDKAYFTWKGKPITCAWCHLVVHNTIYFQFNIKTLKVV